MKIIELHVRSFRGFEDAVIRPREHVVLVGASGAGRTDLIEGLERVLSPNGLRSTPTELDFYRRDLERRPEVEVTIGDLGPELERAFVDQLEVWDRSQGRIVHTLTDPSLLDRAEFDFVVRLAYRIRWNEAEDIPEHWVDFPKASDPELGVFTRVSRPDRGRFRFAAVRLGSLFDLRPKTAFRGLVDAQPGADFEAAIEAFRLQLAELVGALSQRPELASALELVIAPLRSGLALGDASAPDIISFVLEGDRTHEVFKAFIPSFDDQRGSGCFGLDRCGSSLPAHLAIAQALACTETAGAVVVVDDFGDRLDESAVQHMAALLRRECGQVWLSTRRHKAAEVFEADELVRLAFDSSGRRAVHQGSSPRSKAERVAARHRNSQLLPAMGARAVIIVEGPHDRAAYGALAARLMDAGHENGFPAAHGVQLADSGSEGGSSTIPKLALLARQLGLRVVAMVDHDGESPQAAAEMSQLLATAHSVIQLPDNHAIEHAIVASLSEADMRSVMAELRSQVGEEVPDVSQLSGRNLTKTIQKSLKSLRLHAHFIETLPDGVFPPVARVALEYAVAAAVDPGVSGLIRVNA